MPPKSIDFTPYQEAMLLYALVASAAKDGEVSYYDDALQEGLSKAHRNGNVIEDKLFELNEAGVIAFEMFGEDGFRPLVMLNTKPETYVRLGELIQQLEENRNSLEDRLSKILTFNPNKLGKELRESSAKIPETRASIQANDLLKPLAGHISKIDSNFKSLESVFSNYEEIYKNIIRPVQEEGKAGVRQTVRWAVISIIVSLALPLIISNRDQIVEWFRSLS